MFKAAQNYILSNQLTNIKNPSPHEIINELPETLASSTFTDHRCLKYEANYSNFGSGTSIEDVLTTLETMRSHFTIAKTQLFRMKKPQSKLVCLHSTPTQKQCS